LNEVDLHCHTTASDGVLSPTELVQRADRLAVAVIAVTDHDSTEGVAEALSAGRRCGVEVIPGVEINTDVPEGEVHILGYFVDHADTAFTAELQRLRRGRLRRAERMVEVLARLGAPISLERVLQIASDGAVGRPHVARALLEAGHVATFGEAFDRFIGRHSPAYIPRTRFTPSEACALIRSAAGVPVFAHPVIFGTGGVIKGPLPLDTMVPQLMRAGLMGLEVYYAGYDAVTTEYLMGLARRHRLLMTGGSDYHGGLPDHYDLGSVYVPRRVVRRLREAWEDMRRAE
jgi:3',5'-nucleoside bisphosphate phosphatase